VGNCPLSSKKPSPIIEYLGIWRSNHLRLVLILAAVNLLLPSPVEDMLWDRWLSDRANFSKMCRTKIHRRIWQLW